MTNSISPPEIAGQPGKPSLDHVRRPDLPWRDSHLTECGRDLDDVKQFIERPELLKRLADWGKQRTSLHTCMSCWETAARWPVFDTDPVMAMSREFYGHRADPRFAAELRALAALAEKYKDEFTGYIQGLDDTISLQERRTARMRRLRGRQ